MPTINYAVTTVLIAYANLIAQFERNPRLDYDVWTMVNQILLNGLQEPLTVNKRKSGKIIVIKGHRRIKAIGIIAEKYPEQYEAMFGKGIPCIVHEGLSEVEETLMRIDHSEQKELNSKFELYLSVRELALAGMTQKAMAVHLDPLLEKFTSSAKRGELAKIRKIVDVADREAKTLDFHKGQLQGLLARTKAPTICEESWKKEFLGEDVPFKMTLPRVKALTEAFQKDQIKAVEDGKPNSVTKDKPGVEFHAKWEEFVKAEAEKDKTPAKRKMGVKGIEEFQSKLSSRGMVDVCKAINGETVEDVLVTDNAYSYTDDRDMCPDEWNSFVEAVVAARKLQQEAVKEQAAQKASA